MNWEELAAKNSKECGGWSHPWRSAFPAGGWRSMWRGRTNVKLMLKTWVKQTGIADIGAYFSVRDAQA